VVATSFGQSKLKLAKAFGKINFGGEATLAKPLWQVYLPLRQSLFMTAGHL
jgi:hypothetical protein